MKQNINKILAFYLFTLIFFSIFYLFFKSQTGNDSTIAEWLINYEGGFTKRGLVGQMSIIASRLIDIDLRLTIFFLQSLACCIYFICIFNFFKFYEFNRISLLALFSPIFILYPIAEIEVLARKEILVFTLYFLYLFIPYTKFYKNLGLSIYFIFAILIWEPVIFYIPIFIAIEIISRVIQKINFELVKIVLSFMPGIIIGIYFAFHPLDNDSFNTMKNALSDEFGESCYGACSLLNSKSTILQQFTDNIPYYSFEIIIRYFLITIIGFSPLIILLKNSSLKNKEIIFFSYFNNLLTPTIICLTPVLLLFAMGYDWGRWVNITYVFTIIFYFYINKNNYLEINTNIKNNILFRFSKKTFVIIFVIFCFSWNPKTVMTGDVGSFPIYRIPYKAIKTFNNNF